MEQTTSARMLRLQMQIMSICKVLTMQGASFGVCKPTPLKEPPRRARRESSLQEAPSMAPGGARGIQKKNNYYLSYFLFCTHYACCV